MAPAARFGRDRRLRVPAQFRRVFADPVKAGDRHVTVLARTNDTGSARLGLAASKRNLRRAVDRNRFKRLVRESFRAHQGRLAGLDLVVIARRDAASAERRQLRASIDRQWSIIRRRADARGETTKGNHG